MPRVLIPGERTSAWRVVTYLEGGSFGGWGVGRGGVQSSRGRQELTDVTRSEITCPGISKDSNSERVKDSFSTECRPARISLIRTAEIRVPPACQALCLKHYASKVMGCAPRPSGVGLTSFARRGGNPGTAVKDLGWALLRPGEGEPGSEPRPSSSAPPGVLCFPSRLILNHLSYTRAPPEKGSPGEGMRVS